MTDKHLCFNFSLLSIKKIRFLKCIFLLKWKIILFFNSILPISGVVSCTVVWYSMGIPFPTVFEICKVFLKSIMYFYRIVIVPWLTALNPQNEKRFKCRKGFLRMWTYKDLFEFWNFSVSFHNMNFLLKIQSTKST